MILDVFLKRCKLKPKNVVYPEGEDERLIQAASYCKIHNIAQPILIGNKKIIESKAHSLNANIDGIQILEVSDFDYTQELFDTINADKKRIDKDQAKLLSQNPLYVGALLTKKSIADMCIGGAISDTADVIKAALYVIGLKDNIKLLSSFFFNGVTRYRVWQ